MTDGRTAPEHTDDGDPLAGFGYRQQLDRSIGRFASFAAGVSYISILTGTFQLFYFGFGAGGPAYLWSWPVVFVGQLMVALCFAELAARFPVAGSLYNWTKRLGNRTTVLDGRLDDAHRVGRDAVGHRPRVPDHAAAAVVGIPARRRRHGHVRLRGQRRDPGQRAHRLHHAGQRLRRAS